MADVMREQQLIARWGVSTEAEAIPVIRRALATLDERKAAMESELAALLAVPAGDGSFTTEEQQALIGLLRENLGYYHEALRDEHATVEAAMAAFDATPAVTALMKLDPDGVAVIRIYVEDYIAGYKD